MSHYESLGDNWDAEASKKDNSSDSSISNRSSIVDRIPSSLQPVLGIFVTFLISFFFALANVAIKKLEDVDPFTINSIMNGVMATLSLIILTLRKLPLFPKGCRLLLVIRATMGTLAFLFFIYALKHVPIGDANTIASFTPALVVILAWFVLREPVFINDMVNLLLGVLGILCVAQPSILFGTSLSRDDNYDLGAALLVCYCFVLSISYVILRKLRDLPFVNILLVLGSEACVLSLALGFLALDEFQLPKDFESCCWSVLVGVLLFLSETCMTVACQLEGAGLVSILQQAFAIIITMTIQLLFYKEIPNALGTLGIVLIATLTTNLTVRKLIEGLAPDTRLHLVYDKLCCMSWPSLSRQQ